MTPCSALILVDLQNAFCDPNGSFCKRFGPLRNIAATLAACARLRTAARARGILTVFNAMEFSSNYSNAGLLVRQRAPQIATLGGYLRGSWDAAIVSKLVPLPGDLLISKTRYDPFVGTSLERVLRRKSVTHLVVAGVLTNVCVEACVRSAFDRDFSVTVIRDATTALTVADKTASLRTMERHYARIAASRARNLFTRFPPDAQFENR